MKYLGIPRTPAVGLAVVGLGASTGPLDFAVAVAFPAITAAFGLETSETRWVAIFYVLSYGSLMLAFGALGDRIGHLRVFRVGLILSTVSLIMGSLVPSYGWLLASRVVQGVGVALILSCGPALAIAQFDDTQRTRALSRYGVMAALAAVIAPILGGQAIAVLGWQGVFWFRLPIVLLALLLLPLAEPPAARVRPPVRTPFDLAGSLILSFGVGCFLLLPGLMHMDSRGWLALPAALAGAALLAVFIHRQRGSATPFLPPEVARDATFLTANLSSMVMQFATFTVPLLVPYFLKRVMAIGPLATGVLLALWATGSMLGSSVAGRAVAKRGAAATALHAGLLATAGLVGVACWGGTVGYAFMTLCLVVQGFGIGMFQVAYSDLVVAALPPSARGVAGSLTMVTRTFGIVVGASAWMAMVQTLEDAGLARGASQAEAFVGAFHDAVLAAIAVAGLFFALSWRRWR